MRDLDAPVLLPAGFSSVAASGLTLAVTDRGQPCWIHNIPTRAFLTVSARRSESSVIRLNRCCLYDAI